MIVFLERSHYMKRIISIVLVAVMIISVCGMAAFAVEPRAAFFCPRCGGTGYTVVGEEDGVTTVSSCDGYTGSHKHFTICIVDYAICESCQHTWVVTSFVKSIWCCGLEQFIYYSSIG